MPTIYVPMQQMREQGNVDSGGLFVKGGVNYPLRAPNTRAQIFRFANVPIPKGSAISSATLHLVYSGKNNTGSVYSHDQSVYYDAQIPSKPLDTTRNEWTTPARTWTLPAGHAQTTWTFVQGTATSRQLHSHNVKPHLDAAIAHANWTLAGGSMSFMLTYSRISHPDYIYLHTAEDSFSPTLEITYNEPASDGKQTVVNVQENANMMNFANSDGSFSQYPWEFNSFFGAYVQPTLSYSTTPAPPHGGRALRVQATTGKPMVILGYPKLEEGEWYNHSCYVYIPNTTPPEMSTALHFVGDKGNAGEVTARGQWVRQDLAFISDGSPVWTAVRADFSPTWDATSEFYVANVQLTKGRLLRPYIDGNQTATNADYGWAGVNSQGFVRAAPPSASVNTQTDKARRKYYAVNWNYTSPAGHAQVLADIQVRKVD